MSAMYTVSSLMHLQYNFYNYTLGRAPDQWDNVRFIFETYIPVTILIIGLIGNSLLCVMMCYLRRRRNPSFYLLFILGITDTITLVLNFIYYFIFPWLIHKPHFMQDVMWCRIMGMFSYATMGCSAWVLATMVSSRFIAVHFPFRKVRIPHMRKCVAIVYIVAFLAHTPFAYLMDHDDTIGICLLSDSLMARIMSNVHLILFILLPFVLLVVFNTLVSRDIRQKRKRDQSFRIQNGMEQQNKQKRNTTAMLVATSWVYLVLTIPWYIQDVYWHYLTTLDQHKYNSVRYASHSIGYALTMLSYASNFYVYCLCFTNFRQVFSRMCLCGKRGSYSPARTSQQVSTSV